MAEIHQFDEDYQPDPARRRGGRPKMTFAERRVRAILRSELQTVSESVALAVAKLKALSPTAVEVIAEIMLDSSVHPSHRLEAAELLLCRIAPTLRAVPEGGEGQVGAQFMVVNNFAATPDRLTAAFMELMSLSESERVNAIPRLTSQLLHPFPDRFSSLRKVEDVRPDAGAAVRVAAGDDLDHDLDHDEEKP